MTALNQHLKQLADIQAKSDALEQERKALQAQAKGDALQEVKKLVQAFALTALEVFPDAVSGSPTSKPATKKTVSAKEVKPKYRGPNGETWAGRGRKPTWLEVWEKNNPQSTIAELLIDKADSLKSGKAKTKTP